MVGNAHITVMFVVWHSVISNLNIHWCAYNDDQSPYCYVCGNPLSKNDVLNTHAHEHDTRVMCVVRHSLIVVT
jgi:hypothetical protein